MAAGGLHVEDGDFDIDAGLADDLEDLALTVGLHVQGDDARGAAAASRAVGDLQACADPCELDVEKVRVHERSDTNTSERVRSDLVIGPTRSNQHPRLQRPN
jgi:hypothetical protein